MTELRFEVDPRLDDELRARLVHHWVDVTNADGAVGFVPPVTNSDVEPVAREMFRKVAAGDAHLVVARRGPDVVGFSLLVFRPGPLFRHWATIKHLQVHPRAEGTGVGTSLLDKVHEVARSLGLEQLHLTVRGGTGIETFYTRRGYEIVCRIEDLIRLGPGDDREEIALRLYL